MSNDIYNKSYVYMFVMKNETSFKIGKSDNPQDRFNQLKSKYDFKEQFYVINCEDSKKSYHLEKLLHQTFSKFNIVCESREFFEYNVYQNVCDLIENFTNHDLKLIDVSKNKDPFGKIDYNRNNIINFLGLIKIRRKLMGYTQLELSKKMGCSRNTLNKIENSNSFSESFKLYMKVADLLKINVSFT